MLQYIAKRVLLFVPTLFLVSVVIFLITSILPGDLAVLILGGAEGLAGARAGELQALRQKLGIDRPLVVQYARWIWDVVRGDLGTSIWHNTPVAADLKARLPVSLELAVMGFLVAHVLALPLGCLSALKQDTPIDYVARFITMAGVSIPYFWLAILIVLGLVGLFKWLPPLGYAAPWDDPLINIQQLIFPALALGLADAAFVARVTRSALLDVLREDYIMTARSKGLREPFVVSRHAFWNALLPVITVSGWTFARLIGGTVITETVFLVPGLGSLLIDSISRRDLPVLKAIVLLIALIVLSVNLIVDLFYAWLDPRVRYA